MSKENIIIYPHFGQLTSMWNVSKAQGCYKIQLLESADNNSLVLFNLDRDGIHTVKHTMVEGSEGFNVGDEVAISGEIGTYTKHVIGKLKSIQPDLIEIVSEIDHKTRTYRIKDYKQIAVNKVSEASTVNVNLTDLKGELQMSYLFNNIGWHSHYTIIFNNDKIDLFKMVGKIDNQNEKLSGNVVLIAGNISKPHRETVGRSMVTEIKHSKFLENYRYNIGSQCIKNTLSIDLISESDIDSTKYYVHDVESHNIVTYGYRMMAPKFLPYGDLYLYHRSSSGIIYAGTSQIKETREGTDLSFMVGTTNQVEIESSVSHQKFETSIDGITSHQKDVTINTKLTNLTDQLAVVELRYYVGNNKVISTNRKPSQREKGYLIWKLTLDRSDLKIPIVINLELSNN